MKHLISQLRLVYPPISNQEGDWLSEVEAVKEITKTSKFYMMGHREELFFIEEEFTPEGCIQIKIKMGDIISPLISYNLNKEIMHMVKHDMEIEAELGNKLIRIRDSNNHENVLTWFTPDILLYLMWRRKIDVKVEEEFDFRVFTNFELYYVGISKENDSLTRLFNNAHKGRLSILTNGHPKTFGSRISDELVIFMFEHDYFNINVLSTIEEVEQEYSYISEEKLVIADAEKAFINLLNTKFNKVKYNQFPKGEDGLYSEGLKNYIYTIKEDISFYTDDIQFNGIFNEAADSDFIFVEGDVAKIVKAT